MEAGKVDLKLGDWIEKAFNLWKANLGVLIPVGIVGGLLSLVTGGILAGPMAVGSILITFALIDKKEPKPVVGDLFKGFQYFLPSFLVCLATIVVYLVTLPISIFIPCVGPILSMAVNLAVPTLLIFALFLIADKNMDFMSAIKGSIDLAKQNFFPLLALNIVAGAIASVGMIACGIGVLATLPIYYCILAYAYRDIFGVGAPVPAPSGNADGSSGTPV